MKNINKQMYLIGGVLFAVISVLSVFKQAGNKQGLISGVTISLLCIIFSFVFKVKWNTIARESLLEACEKIKPFGNSLPLNFLGKLQLLWILLLLITLFQPLVLLLVPTIPISVFTVIENIAFSFFIFSTFYNLFQGNVKIISITTAIFALYNIIDVYVSFFSKNVVSTRGMCLFLVFWSIHNIFDILLKENPPEETPAKTKKDKKPKKNKKDKLDKATQEKMSQNEVAADEFIDDLEDKDKTEEDN